MKIEIEKVALAIKKGLTIEEYIVLCITEDGCSYLFEKDYPSLQCLSNLVSKGYFNSSEEITLKGKAILKEIEGNVSKKVDNNYKDLYIRLGELLKSKIGKKQIMGYGGKYFMPSSALEIENTLKRFWKFYPEYNDIVKIEKCLTNHIETCCKKSNFAPAIQYFIIRENEKNKPICQILSAYDGLDEVDEIKQKEELTDTKDLF